MRDWNVRKPATRPTTLDLDRVDPPPPAHPTEVETPWGETFRQCADGYYRVHPRDAPLSLGAVHDKIDRFHLRWQLLAPGRCYRIVPVRGGARIATLWRNADGSYRCGHVALRGPRDGIWLAQRDPFRRAATRVELWWLGLGLTTPGTADPAEVQARLTPRKGTP